MGKTYSIRRRDLITAAIVFAAIVAMLMPRAIEAATGSAVNIVDKTTSSYKAKVSSGGRLYTTMCDTDSCAAVDSGKVRISDGSGLLSIDDGNGSLTIDGTTGAFPAVHPNYVQSQPATMTQSTTTPVAIYPGANPPLIPPTTSIAVTDFVLANSGADNVSINLSRFEPDGPACEGAGGTNTVVRIVSKAGETLHLSPSQAFRFIPPGTEDWCIAAVMTGTAPTSAEVNITMFGYTY